MPNQVLQWYDAHRRDLPWRAAPGRAAPPYAVWLSEIMLQQTIVVTVRPYFEDFMRRWPDICALAAAEREDVLRAWAGLGYYARARNLHACANEVCGHFGGKFPEDEAKLRELPGIGPYTAAAISAIAFGHPAVVVDGNIERVMARLHAVETPLPRAKSELKKIAAEYAPQNRPGDYAQGLMDIGATICRPKSPSCDICPLAGFCAAHAGGTPESYPRREAKRRRPVRRGRAYWLETECGKVLLRRRPDKGLLGGMSEFPGSEWSTTGVSGHDSAPLKADWQLAKSQIRHVFTHFELELDVFAARIGQCHLPPPPDCRWVDVDGLQDEALPSLMQKVTRLMQEQE